MTVRLFYVDESHGDGKFCLSALGIRHGEWKECLDRLTSHRKSLLETFGVNVTREIHATELTGGRGRLGSRQIGKYHRSQILRSMLLAAAALPGAMLINVCLTESGHRDAEMVAWDRLLNRINRCMRALDEREHRTRISLLKSVPGTADAASVQKISERLMAYRSRAIVVADQGREQSITSALRRMHAFNHIPSKFGRWFDGRKSKNIVIERVVEDPVFRRSDQSHFIQIVDCIAYSLLKRETKPSERVEKYGIHKMFDECVSAICLKAASSTDPLGIVRR